MRSALPWVTLLVNILGCAAIGGTRRRHRAPDFRATPTCSAAADVPVLGGFTTFSSFGLDSMGANAQGEWLYADRLRQCERWAGHFGCGADVCLDGKSA